MRESEVIHLLQHYRHDLLNQLQLVQGYLSMNNQKKAKEKLNELFSALHEERKLTSLQVPHFALWLLQFNHVYKNFRITYKINFEKSVSIHDLDEILVTKCKNIISLCEKNSDPYVLYEVELVLAYNNDRVEVSIPVPGLQNIIHALGKQMENISEQIEETGKGIVFQFENPKG